MDFSVPSPIPGKCIHIVHIVQKNMEWNAHPQYCKQPVILGGEIEKHLSLLEWNVKNSPIQRLYEPLIWGVEEKSMYTIIYEHNKRSQMLIYS